MAHPRRFRFGVQFVNARDSEEWRQKVRQAENLGYDTVCLSDHFMDQLAPIPGLMAAADATSTVRIGACVLDNDFRHPVVLAKEIATLDVLSGGRVELGIGAGWLRSDYEQSGICYDPAGTRIDRLVEALKILRGLFAEGTLNFDGRHYQVHLDGRPKPVQRPHPPIFMGGGGRRMLTLAAREADIVGINFNLRAGQYGPALGTDTTVGATDQKLCWVREAAGARYADLELQVLVFVPIIASNREEVARGVARHFGAVSEDILEMPYALIGRVDQIVSQLEQRREKYDISYITIGEQAMHAFAPVVERLAGQ